MADVTTAPTGADSQAKGRRALRGAMFGFFVDMFDVYLPVVALAPAIAYFLAPHASAVEKATVTAAIFAVSLVGRPIGALIFGPLGDRVGRRRTTILSAAGFTVCTGLIAVLPGYAQLGIMTPILLIVLRLLDGIFLGGEYTAANPLAMEYAPKHHRGLYGGLIHIGYPGALATITLLTMATLHFYPAGGADASYSTWGWRIPVAIGFVLSAMVFVQYLKSVPESEIWTRMTKLDHPLRSLVSNSKNRRSLGLAFVVGTGAWFTLNGTVGVFAGHFKKLGTPVGTVNATFLLMAVIAMALFPFVGQIAQRVGRGTVIGALGILNIVVGVPAFGFAVGSSDRPLSVIVFGILALLLSTLIWSVITPFIVELFGPQIRSSGYGVAYSLPSVIPAFSTYFMLGLGGVMPYDYTPLVLTAVGGLCLIAGAVMSSDLRHIGMEDG